MRCETGAAVISTLTHGLDATLAEPLEIRPQNQSPRSASLPPPLLPNNAPYSILLLIGLRVVALKLSWRGNDDYGG